MTQTEFEQQKSQAEMRLRRMAESAPSYGSESVPPGYAGNSVREKEEPAEIPDDGVAEVSARHGTGLLDGLRGDDVLLVAVFWLLFNENKQDDILILLLLAVILLS